MDWNEAPAPDDDHIRGRVLRFLVTRELKHAKRPLTVAQLIERIEGYGFVVRGRASKTISDSLRWEIAKGRVVRVSRGVYRYGSAPRSTTRRIDRLCLAALDWIVAMTRTNLSHPVTNRTEYVPKPWDDYRWLWRT